MNCSVRIGCLNQIKIASLTIVVSLLLILSGCSGGGGDGGGGSQPVELSSTLSGGGVKGPLANANFSFYEFDPVFVNFQASTAAISGVTDAQAKFTATVPTADINPPYIVVFESGATTIDLMTNAAPIISSMKTVVTQDMLDSGKGLYATPLTSMAVDIAIKNTLSNREPYISSDAYRNALTVKDKFLAALPIAAQQVKSTLGFGLNADIDIYTVSPLVDTDTNSTAKLAETAQYRGAVEAFGAVVNELKKNVEDSIGSVSTDVMVSALVEDLADGKIDGINTDGNAINILPVEIRTTMENIDPEQLIIPGTTIPVSDVEMQLAQETTATGFAQVDTTALSDATVDIVTAPAVANPDRDADGTLNTQDAFPDNPNEQLDTDRDGLGNNADSDDDGDGTKDSADIFPLNSKEWADTDSDCGSIAKQTITSGAGCGDNSDSDIDGDSVANAADDFPFDGTKSSINDQDGDGWQAVDDPDDNNTAVPAVDFLDTDGDGLADEGGLNPDTDDDNDGVPDTMDVFPTDATEYSDLDGNGTGDNTDTDIDGDGVLNTADAFPYISGETIDTDNDGIGNNADTDDDNDSILDSNEASPACALLRDCDADGRMDANDAFPADPTEWIDTDGDGTGNNADTDDDNDTVPDATDAFPLDSTRSAIVVDTDDDGFGDTVDNCPADVNPLQLDKDTDGTGDACDNDIDGDTALNTADNCALVANTDQADLDGDGIGDACDNDIDADGVLNAADNCPTISNTDQADTDGNGTGDACGARALEIAIKAGINWFEEETSFDQTAQGEVTSYLYGRFAVDAGGVGSEIEYSYNPTTSTFEIDAAAGGNAVKLSAAGWVAESLLTENVVFNADGTATTSDTDASDNIVSQFKLSLTATRDMSGISIAAFLAGEGSDKYAAAIIPTTSVFSTGSEEYTVTDTSMMDEYSIWCGGQMNTTTGDTCNAVNYYDTAQSQVYAQTLAEILEPTTQNGTGKNIGFAETANNWISVELVGADANVGTSGTATYYATPKSGGTPTALTSTGQWTVSTVMGQDLLTFSIPAAINATLMYDDGPDRFLVVYDSGTGTGWLRLGNKSANGNVEGPFKILNDAAKAQLIASFDPSSTPGFDVNDWDGDGVVNSLDAYDGDAARDTDTDGDGLADNVYVLGTTGVRNGAIDTSVGDTDDDADGLIDTADNCPLFADASNNPAPCDNSGILGIHKINATIATLVDTSTGTLANACFDPSDDIGVANLGYLSFTDAGNGAVIVDRDLRIIYNGATGAFTGTSTDVRDEFFGSLNGGSGGKMMVTQVNTVSGNINASGVWSGTTYSETTSATDAASGDTLACVRTEDITGNLDYIHTGSEDYSGIYAAEFEFYDNGGPQRETDLLQIDVDTVNGTVKVHYLDDNDPSVVLLNETETSTFEPATGQFQIDYTAIYRRDLMNASGTVTSSTISCEDDSDRGTFVADPAGGIASGAVMVVVETNEHTRDFNNTSDPAVCASGQTPDGEWFGDGEGYAKLVAPTGFSRTILVKSSGALQDKINMGFQNPPIKLSTGTSNLWLQVLSGSSELCSVAFNSDSNNNGKLVINQRNPAPDASTFSFQSGPYGLINCDTTDQAGNATVVNGTAYTVRILDTGANGVKDTTADVLVGDDVEVYTALVAAEVVQTADRFTKIPSRKGIVINGAKASQTQSGGTIPLYGLFNPGVDNAISWGNIADGQSSYQVRVEDIDGILRQRFNTNGGTFTTTISAGTLDSWSKQTIRITAVKKDSASSTALAHSGKLEIQAGLRGLINVETDHADPTAGVFQLYVDASADGQVRSCIVMNRLFTCTPSMSTRLDMSNNTLTLDMTDDGTGTVTGTAGQTFIMSVLFSDSVTGAVTAYPGPSTGVIRVVSPELIVRARQTNSGNSTHVVLLNPVPTYNTGGFTTAASSLVLDAGVATSWSLWDNASVNDFAAQFDSFVRLPIDGTAQKTAGFLVYDSLKDASLGMFTTTEQYIATLSGSMDGSADAKFKLNFAPPSVVSEPVVLKAAMLVNGLAVTSNTAGTPLVLTTPGVGVTWSTPASFPGTTVWGVNFKLLDPSGNPMPHAKVRSAKVSNGMGATLSGTTTNDWVLDAPIMLPAGLYQMNIRAENATVPSTEDAMSQKVFISVP